MSYRSFKELLHMLTPYLQVNAMLNRAPAVFGAWDMFPHSWCFIVCYVFGWWVSS